MHFFHQFYFSSRVLSLYSQTILSIHASEFAFHKSHAKMFHPGSSP